MTEAAPAPKYTVSFWHPNKDNKGHAIIFELGQKGDAVFMTMMPQATDGGDKKFDNSKKLTTKLGDTDLGEFLAVLNRRKEGAGRLNDKKQWSGLYHTNADGNSIIGFSTGQYGYSITLSVSKGGGQPTRYFINLTDGELEWLRVFIEECARRMQSVSR